MDPQGQMVDNPEQYCTYHLKMEYGQIVEVSRVSLLYGNPLFCKIVSILKLATIFNFYSSIIVFVVFISPSFFIMTARFIFADT